MMRINALIPTELLRPFILTYLIIDSPEEGVNKVLPDTSMVMAFHYKGSVSCMADNIDINLPPSSISGLRRSMRSFHYSKNTGNILVLYSRTDLTSLFFRAYASSKFSCVCIKNSADVLNTFANFRAIPEVMLCFPLGGNGHT